MHIKIKVYNLKVVKTPIYLSDLESSKYSEIAFNTNSIFDTMKKRNVCYQQCFFTPINCFYNKQQ